MHFGAWHPIENAGALAPEGPGVLQARAEGLLDYPEGRSAMLFYAHTEPGGGLRGLVSGLGQKDLRRAVTAGARWIRFAETVEPAAAYARLMDTFVERFGARPVVNATPPGTRSGRPS